MPEKAFHVVAEIYVDAAPEEVFSFFVDPDKLARWQGSPRHLDPRPGGGFRIAVSDDELAVGQFLKVEPNRRLVLTWGLDGGREAVAPGSSVVDVSFVPERRGTVVRVVHRLLTERGEETMCPRLRRCTTVDPPTNPTCFAASGAPGRPRSFPSTSPGLMVSES